MKTMCTILVIFLFVVNCKNDFIYNYQDIGANLPPNTQPSGIIYLDDIQRVVIANDEGYICTMTLNGTDVRCLPVVGRGKMDIEDLCLVRKFYQERGTIFIALEYPPGILEYDMRSGLVVRHYDISAIVPATSKHGLESLAFIPNATSLFGGVFYAGTQMNGNIYKFELFPNTTKFNYLGSFDAQVGNHDLAGMYYHEENENMYVVVDKLSKMFAINLFGGVKEGWKFLVPPVTNPEGIFIIHPNILLIADDFGTVFTATIDL
jgi:hypothetical protein